MDDKRRKRIEALKDLFEEQTAADLDAACLHLYVDRQLGLRVRVEDLQEAGLHTQADELLRRINELMPGSPTPAAALPAPPPPNGVPARPLDDAPRRRPGRPPKARGEGSTP